MTCNRDKNSMKGKGYVLMTTIACRALGGEVSKMTCNRDKNSLQAKDVHCRNTIACRALVGKFGK